MNFRNKSAVIAKSTPVALATALTVLLMNGCTWDSELYDTYVKNGKINRCDATITEIQMNNDAKCKADGCDSKCDDDQIKQCNEYIDNKVFERNACPAAYPSCSDMDKGICVVELTNCGEGQHSYDGSCEDDSKQNCGQHGIVCENEDKGWASGTCEYDKEQKKAYCKASGCKTDYELDKTNHKCVRNCDIGKHANGSDCEENTMENCGSPGYDCAKVPGWKDGNCDIKEGICKATDCIAGYELKDGRCEARINCEENKHLFSGECEEDSLENCGSHGNDCAAITGWNDGECSGGECVATECKEGFSLEAGKCGRACQTGQIPCAEDGVCINPNDNRIYCGATGTTTECSSPGVTCTGGQQCDEGACTCPANASEYCKISDEESLCVDPLTNNMYCGCNAESAGDDCSKMAGENGLHYNCVDGSCKLTNCNSGETQCGDTCIDLYAADMNNCGKCGLVCSADAPAYSSAVLCDLGKCRYACNEGYFNKCLLTATTDEEKLDCTLGNKIECVKVGTNTCCGDECTNCENLNTAKDTYSCSAGSCVITACTPGQQFCAESCKTVATDNSHCGFCNNKCGESTSCVNSACTCSASGKSNCGTDAAPNCRDLKSDVDYCGNCDTKCEDSKPVNTHVTSCASGVCKYECDNGFYNKGGADATSINCVRIGTNTCCGSNCDDCDAKASGNTYFACTDGSCQKSSCGQGEMLCGGSCTKVDRDSNNCGACGYVCGVGMTCSNGKCSCSSGKTNCAATDSSPSCIDLKTSKANCGGCGITCASRAPANSSVSSCSNGVCYFTCNDGFVNKGTGTLATTINCVKVGTNTCCGDDCTNCEALNTSTTTYSCSDGGSCVISACKPGQLYCSGDCKTVSTDSQNCGACGNVCGTKGTSKTTCSNGKCVCETTGQVNCGTDKQPVCVQTGTNPDYCGSCAVKCSNIAPANASVKTGSGCVAGVCQFECNEGYKNKGTGNTISTIDCVKIGTNTCCGSNCEVCGNSNGTYYTCSSTGNDGTCIAASCGSGLHFCSGDCVNLSSNNSHCGECGNACNTTTQKCESRECICKDNSQTNCSGTCVNTTNSATNCGDCGIKCANDQKCQASKCVCKESGLTSCNGTCINTTNSANNCGECGYKCSSHIPPNAQVASTACSSSKCRYTCKEGFVNKGGNNANTADTILCVSDECESGTYKCGDSCLPAATLTPLHLRMDGDTCKCAVGWADSNSKLSDGCDTCAANYHTNGTSCEADSDANCGAHGKACAETEHCDAGVCKCGTGEHEVCGEGKVCCEVGGNKTCVEGESCSTENP